MRTVDDWVISVQALGYNQENRYTPKPRIVFTKPGDPTYTFSYTGTNRILSIRHIETTPGSYKAVVRFDNEDGYFSGTYGNYTRIEWLLGYTAQISYGVDSPAADDYSPTAPLYVSAGDVVSYVGRSIAEFELESPVDLMRKDIARIERVFDVNDEYTLKELITGLLNPHDYPNILPSFSHCDSFTVTWDSEDDIVDTYPLIDSSGYWMFFVRAGETRFDKLQELLNYTKCVCRYENDGAFHLFYPRVKGYTWEHDTEYHVGDFVVPIYENDYTYECTTAGTSGTYSPTWGTTPDGTTNDNTVVWTCRDYHYEYSLSGSNHPFYSKKKKHKLVLPNRVYVSNFHYLDSNDEDIVGFAGLCQDGTITNDPNDSDLFDTKIHYRYFYMPLPDEDTADYIARSILSNFVLNAQTGTAEVPMNVAQELYDYVKITDQRTGDELIGNVQYIERNYNAFEGLAIKGGYKMLLSFGSNYQSVGSLSPSTNEDSPWVADIDSLWAALNALGEQVIDNFEAQRDYFSSKWISGIQRLQITHGNDADKESYPRAGSAYVAEDTGNFYVCYVDGTWSMVGGVGMLTRYNGSSTDNWYSGTATSGETGEDVLTINSDDTNMRVVGLFIDASNLFSGVVYDVRMYHQINGVERCVYDQQFERGNDPDGVWIVSGSITVSEALRVELQSYSSNDTNIEIPWEWIEES